MDTYKYMNNIYSYTCNHKIWIHTIIYTYTRYKYEFYLYKCMLLL